MCVRRRSDTDTAININGDVARDSGGRVYYVSGREETAQRLYILLSAKRGGFIYGRELGSGIGLVGLTDSDAALRVEAYARQALAGMPSAEVTGAAVANGEVTVFVAVDNEEYNITIRREADA